MKPQNHSGLLVEMTRKEAGFTLGQAARIARLHPRRLRSYELHGGATDAVARRLCHFYGAGADVYHALIFGPNYQAPSHFDRVAASSAYPSVAAGLGSGVAAPKPSQLSRRYGTPRTPILITIGNT